MARGTKIALAFLLVLFVGTGIYFTLTTATPASELGNSSRGIGTHAGVGRLVRMRT